MGDAKELDVGCGRDKHTGAIGLDIVDTSEADIVHDVDETPWPLDDDTFKTIYCQDIVEHVEDVVSFMEEVHRVAAEGADIYIRAPHRSSQNWVDPTHKRLFGINTFDNFFTGDSHITEASFTVKKKRITFADNIFLPWNVLMEPLVNVHPTLQGVYESTFLSRLFPAVNIEVWLEAVQE
jgi:SAM-dependent methyltransferase